MAVGVQVGDRARRHAGLHRCLGHRRRDLLDQARIERLRDDVVRTEVQLLAGIGLGHGVVGLGFGQLGDGLHAGQLHCFRDLGGAAIERAAEDVREAQHVVDLVRVVRTARGDDAVRTRGLGDLGTDLRLGVGQRQDDRIGRHGLDHVGGQHAGCRAAQEHVRIAHDVGQRAGRGVLRVARLVRLHLGVAAGIDDALGVDHEHVLALDAQAHHQVQAGDGRGARARHRHLDLADLLADHLHAVEQRGRRDDRRAVLVIVEDGNVQALAQLLLDVEALRRLDVLEVDAAQRRLQRGDDVDQLVRIALGQLDVEHVHAGELLEQAALAFHHRLAGQRADVAQAEHRGAVGDHADQVGARGVLGRQRRVALDLGTRIGHARRIRQRQVALVDQRLGRADLDLAARRRAVVFERGAAQFGLGPLVECIGRGVVKLVVHINDILEGRSADQALVSASGEGVLVRRRSKKNGKTASGAAGGTARRHRDSDGARQAPARGGGRREVEWDHSAQARVRLVGPQIMSGILT